jgi:hypothetical protein
MASAEPWPAIRDAQNAASLTGATRARDQFQPVGKGRARNADARNEYSLGAAHTLNIEPQAVQFQVSYGSLAEVKALNVDARFAR